jgi:hypothetical protein
VDFVYELLALLPLLDDRDAESRQDKQAENERE